MSDTDHRGSLGPSEAGQDANPAGAPAAVDSRPHPRAQTLKCRATAVALILLLTLYRFWFASAHGLILDEAYYWLWARHLDLGYYDQGPGVAIAIRAGLLFGVGPGAVRMAAVLGAAVDAWIAYCLASRIFRDERAGLAAALFLNAVPLLFVGGILMTHDSPQVMTWAASLYCLARAVGVGEDLPAELQAQNRAGWWAVAGLLAGFSVDCKFTAVLFAPAALLFLTRPGLRVYLKTPWPYAAALIASISALPPLLWNAQHQWASARHILGLGGAHDHKLVNFSTLGDFLGGQIAVVLLFLFTLGWASWQSWRRGCEQRDNGLMLAGCFSWPAWIFFLLLSLHGRVEANWPVPSYFSAAVVTPWLCWTGLRDSTPGKRIRLYLFHGLSAALAGLFLALLLAPQSLLAIPGSRRTLESLRSKDRSNEMYGWDQAAAAIERAGWTEGGAWLVAAPRYQEASELAFALPGQPTTYNLPVHRRHNQFDFWPPMPSGSRAIVLVAEKDASAVLPEISALFGKISVVEETPIWRRPLFQQPIQRYLVLRCIDYRGGASGLMANEW